MRAIVIKQYGGPEQLDIVERPVPESKPGHVIIAVKAFGLNRAEIYMRSGVWGDVAEISGIECVGTVESDPDGRFIVGQKVVALMGGMGRSLNGSYAEFAQVPAGNVVPLATNLDWEDLAAIPESYATAWSCLHGNLSIEGGQTTISSRLWSQILGRKELKNARVCSGVLYIFQLAAISFLRGTMRTFPRG